MTDVKAFMDLLEARRREMGDDHPIEELRRAVRASKGDLPDVERWMAAAAEALHQDRRLWDLLASDLSYGAELVMEIQDALDGDEEDQDGVPLGQAFAAGAAMLFLARIQATRASSPAQLGADYLSVVVEAIGLWLDDEEPTIH